MTTSTWLQQQGDNTYLILRLTELLVMRPFQPDGIQTSLQYLTCHPAFL